VFARDVLFSRAWVRRHTTIGGNGMQHTVPAHLQAPEHELSACSPQIDQTRGFHALDRQVASISSPHALPQAQPTGSGRARKTTSTHIPFSLRTICNRTACAGATSDRKASPRSSAPCWRVPHASHRHLVSPGSPSCLVELPPAWPE
jgi:hypothetical protein